MSRNCERLLEETDLPLASDPRSPIQYVEVGLPRMAQQLAQNLMDDGLFTLQYFHQSRKRSRIELPVAQEGSDHERYFVVFYLAEHLKGFFLVAQHCVQEPEIREFSE